MAIDERAVGAGPDEYERILAEYIHQPTEEALYRVSLLSQQLIEGGLGPEDIIALHFEALDRLMRDRPYRERARLSTEAQQFLLEVMITYGVRFKEYLEIKMRQALQSAAAEAARERERALDAERIGRQQDEMLAVIAHEMRTPLAAAQGNLDLAKRSFTRQELERMLGQLDRAREALGRLSRLTADLVESSRDGDPSLTIAPQVLGEVVEQACAWAEPTALAEEVELSPAPAAAPIVVHADADGLLSIFGNLLSNAVRYTPAGGRVTVRCGVADAWAWVEVRDTGIGMTPEVQARIYERFYRSPDARRLEARGLGLGLSLVQKLVRAHGGWIELESAPGHGSTFRVYLPLATEEGDRADDRVD
jgi:two-component system, OmpR family, sensor kinase